MTGKISSRARSGAVRRGRARQGPRRARPLAGADLPQLARPRQRAAEDARIERAVAILERLDIARHLLRLETVDTRLALALQLLEQTVDDVADLAGMP